MVNDPKVGLKWRLGEGHVMYKNFFQCSILSFGEADLKSKIIKCSKC